MSIIGLSRTTFTVLVTMSCKIISKIIHVRQCAISGNIPVGDATVFKVSGDLNTYFCCPAELLKCQSEASLCRTQAVLKIKGDAEAICRDYFLKKPVGNHHIIFPGDHQALFEAFMFQG